jgi:ABC-type nitrate/sulfonate/bicarbonate transport system permease component
MSKKSLMLAAMVAAPVVCASGWAMSPQIGLAIGITFDQALLGLLIGELLGILLAAVFGLPELESLLSL